MIKQLIDKLKRRNIFYVLTSMGLTGILFFGSVATEVLVNPVPAPASLPALPSGDIISFSGRGWGHGVGMCQYGAYGQALQGKNYRQILSYYYTGSAIGSRANQAINVELLSNQGSVGITATGGFVIKSSTGSVIGTGTAGQVWVAIPDGSGKIQVKNPSGKIVGAYANPIKAEPNPITSDSKLKITNSNKRYRGLLTIRLTRYYSSSLKKVVDNVNALSAINNVMLEDYVKGIAEVPAGWPANTLKAQAVAARTYAVVRIGSKASYGFDLYNDQRDQVYMGYEKEVSYLGSKWVAAASETAGQIATYNGNPITTFYFSTCGGSTENSENVWSSALPYLKAKACDYCSSSPKYKWTSKFTVATLESKLKASSETTFNGRLAGISVASRRGPRRAGVVSIYSTSGRKDVTGDAIRRALGLNSTWFYINDLKVSNVGVSPNPFSPNGDKVADSTNFSYTINRNAYMSIKIYSYKGLVATVLNGVSKAAGSHIQSWNGKNNNGAVLVDGSYKYVVSGRTSTGSVASISGLVTIKNSPTLSNVRASPNPFSPNGDSYRDNTYFRFSLNSPARITVKLYNAKGVQKAVIANNVSRAAGNRSIKWNGLNSYGKVVRDGTYIARLTAVNAYGTSSKELTIKLNGKPIISQVSFGPNPFTPDGDGVNDSALLKFTTNCNSTATIEIKNSAGSTIKKLMISKVLVPGTYSRRWYGKNSSGNLVPKDLYTYVIKAANQSGTRIYRGSIRVE